MRNAPTSTSLALWFSPTSAAPSSTFSSGCLVHGPSPTTALPTSSRTYQASLWTIQGTRPASTADYINYYLIRTYNPRFYSPSRYETGIQLVRYTAYVWSFFILGTSIPVYSIIVRYNLLVSGLCGQCGSHMAATVLPWAVAWLFFKGSVFATFVNYYHIWTHNPRFSSSGSVFATFVNWASLISFGVVYFGLPLAAFLAALWQHPTNPQGRPLADQQWQQQRRVSDYMAVEGSQEDNQPLLPIHQAFDFDPLPAPDPPTTEVPAGASSLTPQATRRGAAGTGGAGGESASICFSGTVGVEFRKMSADDGGGGGVSVLMGSSDREPLLAQRMPSYHFPPQPCRQSPPAAAVDTAGGGGGGPLPVTLPAGPSEVDPLAAGDDVSSAVAPGLYRVFPGGNPHAQFGVILLVAILVGALNLAAIYFNVEVAMKQHHKGGAPAPPPAPHPVMRHRHLAVGDRPHTAGIYPGGARGHF